MSGYVIGEEAPPIRPDVGAGPWCAAPRTTKYALYARAIGLAIQTEQVRLKVGPDAIAQMRHYLDNTGTDYRVDVSAMMSRSRKLRRFYDAELEDAKRFAETLSPGTHSLTSQQLRGGYFNQADEPEFFYAIGGYSYWGQGKLLVEALDKRRRRYTLDFEFHFYDRYNWDKGKKTNFGAFTVSDEFLQELHRHCYAREYDVKGEARTHVVWESGAQVPVQPGRNPFDVLQHN